ncbi:hypothetical protein [Herbidospora mongoliensis]|uniref:hypothetical protein n=1 Tax=Herbidospora mongoliensis TaxID=688067 RepID=UPI0012FB28F9|nr:hypothetical protein [Herbidospora mongoliensis]
MDLDFASFDAPSIPDATRAMAEAFRRHGFTAEEVRGAPLLGRLVITDPMKLPLQKAPVRRHDIPVASLDDMVGMKVAALNGRNVSRDLIDVASVRDFYSFTTLERLGSLFDDDFNLIRLVDRLETAVETDARVFGHYNLTDDHIESIRQFALDWYKDLSLRLAGEELGD